MAQQCGAKAKSTGKQCARYSIEGGTVCRAHGGASKQAKSKARRRQVEAKAAAEVAASADAVLAHRANHALENPLDGLARLATEVTAFKDALAGRVNALTSIRYEDAKSAEQLRSEVVLYERALDRTARLLETMVKLDFEKRMLALNEAQMDIMGRAIDLILEGLELTTEQRELVPHVVPRAFEVLEGGKAAA